MKISHKFFFPRSCPVCSSFLVIRVIVWWSSVDIRPFRIKCNCNKTLSQRSLDDEEAASTGSGATATSSGTAPPAIGGGAGVGGDDVVAVGAGGQLVKQSCHDSGIDIRDPNTLPSSGGAPAAAAAAGAAAAANQAEIPVVAPIPTKKVYSDADIVLSADWVPPLTIAPTHFVDSSARTSSTTSSQHSSLSTTQAEAASRKKASSVSFSVEEHDGQGGGSQMDKGGETKKNKVSSLEGQLAQPPNIGY